MDEVTDTFHARAEGAASAVSGKGEVERPRTLGPYELLHRVGAGGMAEVWVAVRRGGFGFRQVFAIKTIRPEYAGDAAFRTMFLDEARLASQVRHTNVLPVLDLGVEGETVYQAMPLVEGDSVAALVKGQREGARAIPLGIALRICIDVARGLHAAHEAKDESGIALALVHRDVSPQNILVGIDGVAKVADFGIAKAFGRAHGSAAPSVVGKRGYLAPEQLRALPIDRRADVFSLGVVLWELLTGERLFKADNAAVALEKCPAPDVRTHRPEVPAAVAETVARALTASAEDRYRTAERFADAMEAAARKAGIDLSTKHVGGLVKRTVGGGRAKTRLSGPTPPRAGLATTSDITLLSVRRAWSPRALILGAAVIALACGVMVFRKTGHATPVATPNATHAEPPAAAPSALSSSAPSAVATLSSPTPTKAALSAPTPTKSGVPKAQHKTGPLPKFADNPYAH